LPIFTAETGRPHPDKHQGRTRDKNKAEMTRVEKPSGKNTDEEREEELH